MGVLGLRAGSSDEEEEEEEDEEDDEEEGKAGSCFNSGVTKA
jgi:hypothetical protein